ncbi:MAG: hypothetical protein CM15mP120_11830 [Pseudomonadota bacterium]|nr:MAG: hypothetical protein CM15mP120_11830 [Pseudomonadota bacterium]
MGPATPPRFPLNPTVFSANAGQMALTKWPSVGKNGQSLRHWAFHRECSVYAVKGLNMPAALGVWERFKIAAVSTVYKVVMSINN